MKNAMQQTEESRRNAENHPPYAVPTKWAKTTLMMAVCLAGTLGFADTAFAQSDPAVVAINFKVLERNLLGTQGRVQIEGVVQNVGVDVYPWPGLVVLYEDGREVSSVLFNCLLPGEEIFVRYVRRWDTRNEFQPSYTVRILLFIDGGGDDLDDPDNNSRTRSGDDINELITPYVIYKFPTKWRKELPKFVPRFFPQF
jgi:hypothetical protein